MSVEVICPLRPCEGPHDAEGAGRERYWDMTPEQRRAELPRILESLKPGTPEGERRFADGWMAELRRDRAGNSVGCRIAAPGIPRSALAPISPEEFGEKLVAWVATVTQLDPEKGELPNVEDWRRNAEKLFKLHGPPSPAAPARGSTSPAARRARAPR